MQRRGRQIQPTNLRRKAIGAVVSEVRREAGFSQERLSADCGFERTYISRVERGILNPTAIRLWMISDTLGTPFHEMVRRMGLWVADRQKSHEL
jgi:transcriptional regulator with XRE-family HTH domain